MKRSDLEGKNLGELKKIAKSKKIKGYSKYRKSDIPELINLMLKFKISKEVDQKNQRNQKEVDQKNQKEVDQKNQRNQKEVDQKNQRNQKEVDQKNQRNQKEVDQRNQRMFLKNRNILIWSYLVIQKK
jgi:hypothetical protein